ncbi:MAG: thioredoxin domain-containing protein [Candidatus Pacebacteria bacterium]|nr:thioredoxin domain-containing protein [Candidatus Paceibacterota bacterium]
MEEKEDINENKKEEKKLQETTKKTKSNKKGFFSKPTFIWQVLTGIFFILAMVFLFVPQIKIGSSMPSQKVIDDVMSFINKDLLQGQAEATLVKDSVKKVENEENLFQFDIEVQGQKFTSVATLDGKYLFPTVLNIDEIKKQQSNSSSSSNSQAQKEIPKSERPEVMLFVMSFCPYGIQAENNMKSVYDLLKDKVDFSVKFITTVNGENLESIDSLHGIEEAKEDLRQICIIDKYGNDIFWNYVVEFNKNCTANTSDSSALDKCWKQVADKLGIKTSVIEKCAYGDDGLNLLKEDEKLVEKYQVAGSPTLIINGQEYQGERDSESYKEAICSTFNKEPSECQTKLSSDSTSSNGGCQ